MEMMKEEKNQPLVSIVIVNHNGKELLRKCLASVLTTDYPNFEIILVDNASADGSVELIERLLGSFRPRIRIVKNPENLGHAEGCNIGARVARGKYLVFLDSDTEIRDQNRFTDFPYSMKDWLKALVKVMEDDESIGLAQAKMVLARNHHLLDNTGIALDALGTWHTTYGLEEDRYKKVFEILAAVSGGCIIRREIFHEAGGFDPDYFIYDDDTDLSLRARLLGYKIVFVPSAIIIHHGEPTRPLSPEKLYHSAKNRICTMLKNYELRNLWWRVLALNFVTFMVSIGFFVFNSSIRAQAVMKGLFYPLKNFKTIWKKRLETQIKRRIRDAVLINKGLIRNDIQSTAQDFKLRVKHALRSSK